MGSTNRPVTSKSEYSISIIGVEGEFSSKTGGARTMPIKSIYQGGATNPTLINGRATYEDVVISRAVIKGLDFALARQLSLRLGTEFTIRQQELDTNQQGIGTPRVYQGRLNKVSDPDVDWNSTDESMLELTFAVQSAT